MFRVKYLKNNETGISPVVGVILMVAVTVVLTTLVGTAVFSFADLSENVTAGATFEQSPEGVTVTYATSGTADGLVVLVDGQEVDGAVLKQTSDMVTVTAGEGEKVTAVGYKGSPDNRETENPIVNEVARSDTTGGSDPTVVSGGTGGGTTTVSGLVAINPNISGATVELVDSTGSVLKTTTTDSNGEYSFDVEDTSNKSVSITVEGFTDPELSHPLYASAKQDVGESNTVDFNFQNEYQTEKNGNTILTSNTIAEDSSELVNLQSTGETSYEFETSPLSTDKEIDKILISGDKIDTTNLGSAEVVLTQDTDTGTTETEKSFDISTGSSAITLDLNNCQRCGGDGNISSSVENPVNIKLFSVNNTSSGIANYDIEFIMSNGDAETITGDYYISESLNSKLVNNSSQSTGSTTQKYEIMPTTTKQLDSIELSTTKTSFDGTSDVDATVKIGSKTIDLNSGSYSGNSAIYDLSTSFDRQLGVEPITVDLSNISNESSGQSEYTVTLNFDDGSSKQVTGTYSIST